MIQDEEMIESAWADWSKKHSHKKQQDNLKVINKIRDNRHIFWKGLT